RYPDDHRERDAVARELKEFLDEHRHPASEREQRDGFSAAGHCFTLGPAPLPPQLSVARCIRWMNTSSSPVSTRSNDTPGSSVASRRVFSSSAPSLPVTWIVSPNAAVWSTPGRPCSFSERPARSGPLTAKVVRP